MRIAEQLRRGKVFHVLKRSICFEIFKIKYDQNTTIVFLLQTLRFAQRHSISFRKRRQISSSFTVTLSLFCLQYRYIVFKMLLSTKVIKTRGTVTEFPYGTWC